MEKTETMKRYEAETGEDMPTVNVYKLLDWYKSFSIWLEDKAAAYDRLMSDKGCEYCQGNTGNNQIRDNKRCSIGNVIQNGGRAYFSVKQYEKLAYIGEITHCPKCGKLLTLPDGWENK